MGMSMEERKYLPKDGPDAGEVAMVLMHSPTTPPACRRSWSISEESLRRYVHFASESCIQELLSASTSGSDLPTNSGEEEWKVISSLQNIHGGVEISKRRGAGGSSFPAFRSRCLLKSVSPQQFTSVANAIDAARQWDTDLVEARYIKEMDDNLSIVQLRYGDKSRQPLFRNREFVVYERRETMEDGTLVVAVASLPKEMAEGLPCHDYNNSSRAKKTKSNAIRGLVLHSGWVVEKLQHDSSCCMVTYVVQLDPGGAGWLPKCFVNRLNTKLVMVVDRLRFIAQSLPQIPNSLLPDHHHEQE
ncbi:unnamed protein product [Linum trigynum]|uniref:START domain-containing protein n=1 Tax=Linum trigynum TaxID=586398 RepID=A0AAV2EHC8_9ROSI